MSAALPRKLIILGIALPIAAYIGFQMADPSFGSWGLVFILASVLCLPLVLKWHHPLLIFSWNLPVLFFFLPGSPHLWMVLSFVSLGISLLGAILDKEQKLIQVPVMTWAMIALGLTVLFTMKMTGGGLGLRVLGGSAYGAKKYFFILFAIAGYFAITCRSLPVAQVNKYIALLIVPGVMTGLSNLIYILGPGLWFLYAMIPVDWALGQAFEDFSFNPVTLKLGRISGLAVAGGAIYTYLIARHGIRGIFDIRKPWRIGLLLLVGAVGLLGGFRSILVTFGLLFCVQFFLEGLHKTRIMPVVAVSAMMGLGMLLLTVDKLPLPIQRCFSVLPVNVHPAVRAEAAGSTEWRLNMWGILVGEIPKYFWVGKGYTASAADYYLTQQAMRMGLARDYESSLLAGDYHNGPLSVIIPFGVWGAIAFLFFLGASFHVLYRNYRHGDPAVRHVNTFLLAAFTSKCIFFFVVFGAVHLDLHVFIGFVAFSISLNGGVCRQRALAEAPAPIAEPSPVRLRPRHALAR